MAYGEGSDNAQLLLQTIRLTFDGSGRSRRTEVIYWWIATALAGAAIGFAAATALPWRSGILADYLLRALFIIPSFALFVRRLHDQDRSGWWSLLLPLSIALSLPDAARWIMDRPDELLLSEQAGPHIARWISGAASIATLVLLLLPGTVGRNRYGDDPRESQEM